MWRFRRCKHNDRLSLHTIDKVGRTIYTVQRGWVNEFLPRIQGSVWMCPDCGKVWYEGGEGEGGREKGKTH